MQFQSFPKIARLSREIVITEKIDGTNAQICITLAHPHTFGFVDSWQDSVTETTLEMFVGSRNRWITPTDDNYGFAAWARDNSIALRQLGIGRHFGEWWGHGINRNYGLDERKFSLFNVKRWGESRPECCDIVPVLYKGPLSTPAVDLEISKLRIYGSVGAPGFMKPEGVVVYHSAANVCFKKTLEKDEEGKA